MKGSGFEDDMTGSGFWSMKGSGFEGGMTGSGFDNYGPGSGFEGDMTGSGFDNYEPGSGFEDSDRCGRGSIGVQVWRQG